YPFVPSDKKKSRTRAVTVQRKCDSKILVLFVTIRLQSRALKWRRLSRLPTPCSLTTESRRPSQLPACGRELAATRYTCCASAFWTSPSSRPLAGGEAFFEPPFQSRQQPGKPKFAPKS